MELVVSFVTQKTFRAKMYMFFGHGGSMLNFTAAGAGDQILANRQNRAIFAIAATLMLLGLAVITGWYTHNSLLTRIASRYVPMQFNTALGFMLSGLGLAAIVRGWRIAIGCAAAILVLGTLTLFEYLGGVSLGIDLLLFTPYTTEMTYAPGRIAPNTALCFTLAGAALLIYASLGNRRKTVYAVTTLGALVTGLGLVGLSSYAFEVETVFGWPLFTHMALHTAAGFMLLGMGLLVLAWREHALGLLHYFSVPTAIGVLTLSTLLWQALQIGTNGIASTNLYPNLLLVFGAILALALAWTMSSMETAKLQARSAEAVKLALETDIAARKQAEAALKESEGRFRSLFEQAAIGIAEITLDGHFLQINEGFARITDYSREEMLELTYQKITYPDDLPSDMISKQNLVDGMQKNYSLEKRYIRKDGSIAWVYLSTALVRDAEQNPLYFISAAQDITQSKNLQTEIEHQARVDYLTGLANRRHFMEQAEQELARALRYGSPLSVAMMDIDHFKRVNDTYGHKVGDLVLQRLSQLCEHMLREVDLIARMGGEEFAILLPETDGKMAMEVAERLRVAIADTQVPLETGLPPHVTVSIGVASLQGKDVNVDMLLNLADKALYEAKHGGRNKVRQAHGRHATEH